MLLHAFRFQVKSILLRCAVVVLVLAMAVQVFRVSRDTADALLDRFGGRFVMVEMRSDRPGMAKLYWNTGSGYNEADSASKVVSKSKRWLRLRFPVPKEPLLAVRFDPLRSEGQVLIRKIQLQSASGLSLFEPGLELVRAGVQVESIRMEGGDVLAAFPVSADDPSLLFGAMVPDGEFDSASLPWVGYLSTVILLMAIFVMRKHTSGIVFMIGAIRSSLEATIMGLAAVDKPGKATLAGGALLVIALQIYLLYPLHQVIDLPLWDEARTMGEGGRFLQGEGLGHLVYSPLSKLIYAGLVGVFGPIGSLFANHYLVKIALIPILFLFSARVAGSVLVGVVLSGVWALSSFQCEYPILSYQSALIWFGLGLLTVGRNPILGLILIVFAALTRLEYQFAGFLVFGCLVLFYLKHRRFTLGLRKSEWVLTAVACGVILTVFANLSGRGSSTGRGWFAVQQHYALRLEQEGEFPGNNPFLEYGLVTERDFPEADSLGAAMRVNLRAITQHMVWNIRHLPKAYLDLFVPVGADRMPYRFPLVVFGLVVATGLVVTCRFPGDAGLRLWAFVSERPVTTVAVLSGLLVIAPGVIVFAKSPYLLPIVPLGLALVGILYRLGSKHEVISRAGVLFALIVVVSVILSGTPPFLDRSRPRPVLATVALIDDALPAGKTAVLLGVSSMSFSEYLGPHRVVPVEPLASFQGSEVVLDEVRFERLIERHDPDLILIDSNWSRSAYFDGQGAARLQQLGWTRSAIPDGSLWQRP